MPFKTGDNAPPPSPVNPGAPVLSLTATDSRTITIKLTEPVVYALELFAPYSGGGNMATLNFNDSETSRFIVQMLRKGLNSGGVAGNVQLLIGGRPA